MSFKWNEWMIFKKSVNRWNFTKDIVSLVLKANCKFYIIFQKLSRYANMLKECKKCQYYSIEKNCSSIYAIVLNAITMRLPTSKDRYPIKISINSFCRNMQNVNHLYCYSLLLTGCICTKTFRRGRQFKSVSIYWSEFVIRLDRAHLSASLFFAHLNGLDSYPFFALIHT